jgi:hypothetical protein
VKKPSRALRFKGWQDTKSRAGLMQLNRTRGASMGRVADASSVPLHDVYRNHCGGQRVKVTTLATGALRRPPRGNKTRSGASSLEAARRLAAPAGSRLEPARPETAGGAL